MEASASGDQELVCKTIQIEHKRFYLDLKENPRGRYLKISEKTAGSRTTIIVPIAGVVWFVDLFNYYCNGDDSELSSKELQLDTTGKVFYFDVGENPRGRFLKVSEASVARNRSTIIVPAGSSGDDGWAKFRNVLVEIHEASQMHLPQAPPPGAQPDVSNSFLPSSNVAPAPTGAMDGGGGLVVGEGAAGSPPTAARVVRAEAKKFFFDLGSNARGQFLRISEVTGADRSAIILPASCLEQVHETLGQFVEMVKSTGVASSPSIANVRTIAPPRKRTEG